MADRGTKPRGEKVDVLAISTEQRQMKGRSRHTPGGENNRWRVFKRHRFSLFGTPFFPIPFCRFCDSQPPILFFVCLPAAGLVLPCFHFFFFYSSSFRRTYGWGSASHINGGTLLDVIFVCIYTCVEWEKMSFRLNVFTTVLCMNRGEINNICTLETVASTDDIFTNHTRYSWHPINSC